MIGHPENKPPAGFNDRGWGHARFRSTMQRRFARVGAASASEKFLEAMSTGVSLGGYDPDTVDYSDPAFPPGMTRGIRPDETAGLLIKERLASGKPDCVMIATGVGSPSRSHVVRGGCQGSPTGVLPARSLIFKDMAERNADAAAGSFAMTDAILPAGSMMLVTKSQRFVSGKNAARQRCVPRS
jgi:hypothetical protein